MPEDVFSPGNIWFSNNSTSNDRIRNKRSFPSPEVFEAGELAREGSWPWVVGITGAPKTDYCHVEVVPSNILCMYTGNNTYITYAEYEDIINSEDIQETAGKLLDIHRHC